jgi:hypothetical protein
MPNPLPPELDIEAVKVRIQQSIRNPHVGRVVSVTLRDGPRAYRIATLYEIQRSDGTYHHSCLRIDSVDRTKDGWQSRPAKSVSLDSDGEDEIGRLLTFLQSTRAEGLPSASGEYRVVPEQEFGRLRDLLSSVRPADGPRRFRLLEAILSSIEVSPVGVDEWTRLFQAGSDRIVQSVSAAARMVEYRRAFTTLATLIEDPTATEADFQRLLAANPWMFGSEYSELLPRRSWSRDDRLDFMLRRTVDGYLEIVEIKTPIGQSLFRYDASHDSYAQSAPLANVVGQVIRYIEEIERSRDTIVAKDGVDTLKARARVIIGRDGDKDQQHALRNLNGHLHRVEVITFDQLLRIAGRVIEVFEDAVSGSEPAGIGDDDFPF